MKQPHKETYHIKENTLQIGVITLSSNEYSLRELVVIAKAIIEDKTFKKYLDVLALNNVIDGDDSYIG